jgi:PTH1 family peptidyl-tRNA hydrolase
LLVWLIVGLGNPGSEYAGTPHNLGFAVLEKLAEAVRRGQQEHKADSFLLRGRLDGKDVLLAQPQAYMNLSGKAVGALLRQEDLTTGELVVVTDDFNLPWETIRIRERGSAGGHNGLESVIGAVGTEEFLRVRLGCQPAESVGDMADYVTTPVGEAERRQAAEMVDQAAEAVRTLLREGAHRAMNRFNRRIDPPSPDGEN